MKYYICAVPVNKEIVVRVNHIGEIAGIPADPANTDYAAYLEWVAAGNTPEPWQPDAQ